MYFSVPPLYIYITYLYVSIYFLPFNNNKNILLLFCTWCSLLYQTNSVLHTTLNLSTYSVILLWKTPWTYHHFIVNIKLRIYVHSRGILIIHIYIHIRVYVLEKLYRSKIEGTYIIHFTYMLFRYYFVYYIHIIIMGLWGAWLWYCMQIIYI